MKKSKFLVRGMLGDFVLRYCCTVRDLHCSRSKMKWKSLLSRVGRPVSMATPAPKVRSGPAVILEPTEVP